MKQIEANKDQIALCGLYCGSCPAFLKEKCPGCKENAKATWCKVRACCLDNSYASCADCKQLSDNKDCKKLNNFMSNLFAFIFRSDRNANINMLKEKGCDEFARYMAENKLISIKK